MQTQEDTHGLDRLLVDVPSRHRDRLDSVHDRRRWKDARMNTPTDAVPSLTTAQMVEVDRAMIEDFHIELIQMMENAGRNLAHLARMRFLDGDPRGKRV